MSIVLHLGKKEISKPQAGDNNSLSPVLVEHTVLSQSSETPRIIAFSIDEFRLW